MPGLRIGSVSYVNALPLTRGLTGLVREVPSRLTERFLVGELDVALLPSVEALRMPGRPIVPGGCIASPGPVDSVLLFHRAPLEGARVVLLDESSRTSSALAQAVLHHRFGVTPEFRGCPADVDPRTVDADAVLLIGDPALQAPRDGLAVTDLASAWREWKGLPFCFAVWVAADEASAREAEPVLAAAKARGLAERPAIAREAAERTGLPAELLATYLTERIRYELGAPERESLEEFARLIEPLG